MPNAGCDGLRGAARWCGLICLAAVLSGCASPQVPVGRAYPVEKPDVLRALQARYAEGEAGRAPTRLTSIELFRLGSGYRHYVAVCAWRDEGGETRSEPVVFRYDDGITYVAGFDEPIEEPRVLLLRPVTLPGFDGPLVEVFGTDDAGNGDYYLYHFNEAGRTLELKLRTFAVDSDRSDGVALRGGRLGAVYYMPTRMTRAGPVALAGIVEHYPAPTPGNPDPEPTKMNRASKSFRWNNAKQRYVTERDDWMGFKAYEDLE